MSLLTHRHGDHARLKADCKRQARVFVEAQPLGADFYAAELAHETGMAFQTASNQLRALEKKAPRGVDWVLTGFMRPGDLRRCYRRLAR